jgi:hypothetical protein
MPRLGLVEAGELIAVVLAILTIVSVVVLELAGVAAHISWLAVGADGVAILAHSRAAGSSRVLTGHMPQ